MGCLNQSASQCFLLLMVHTLGTRDLEGYLCQHNSICSSVPTLTNLSRFTQFLGSPDRPSHFEYPISISPLDYSRGSALIITLVLVARKTLHLLVVPTTVLRMRQEVDHVNLESQGLGKGETTALKSGF
jgi:hypothetical protein